MVQRRFTGPATELFPDSRAGTVASNQVSAGGLRAVGEVDRDVVVVVLGDIMDGLAPLQQDMYSATSTNTSTCRTISPEHPNLPTSNSSTAVAAA